MRTLQFVVLITVFFVAGCASDRLDDNNGDTSTPPTRTTGPEGSDDNASPGPDTPDAGAPDAATDEDVSVCTPIDCSEVVAECGSVDDGCGGTIECGQCKDGEVCGVDLTCEACVAETDDEICDAADAVCGELSVVDSCGQDRTVNCGGCADGELCDSGACVCAPLTCDEVAGGCGILDDGCGGQIVCNDSCPQILTLGGNHTCAAVDSGGAQCWGKNKDGQLGIDSRTEETSPTDVVGLTDEIFALSSGEKHTCALSGGAVWCWGDNDDQQMAGQSNNDALVPVAVPGITNASALGSGGFHTCAIIEDTGGVKCWGANGWGQLGDGGFQSPATPVDVIFPTPAPSIAKVDGGPLFTCFLTTGGELYCLGENTFGQVGTQQNYDDPLTPQHVQGLQTPLRDFASGGWFGSGSGIGPSITGFTCAVESNGGVKCFGANLQGQLGAGMMSGFGSHSLAPAQVVGLTSGVVQVVAGGEHACALTESGDVKCWGYNEHGELGDGTTTLSNVPVDVPLSGPATTIATGGFHTCAILADGGLECWGKNSKGQIGDGTITHAPSPVRVF